MSDAMNVSVSGVLAASSSLLASASNIANANTTGRVPPTPPTQPVRQGTGNVYQPVTSSQTTTSTGGVQATLSPALPGYALAYDPASPFANMQGMVAMPNVDPAKEAVNLMTASNAFKANLHAFAAAQSSYKTLLDKTV